jgi:hypothetical protein
VDRTTPRGGSFTLAVARAARADVALRHEGAGAARGRSSRRPPAVPLREPFLERLTASRSRIEPVSQKTPGR